MLATVSPGPYWSAVAMAAATAVVLCVLARRRPGRWCAAAACVIGTMLFADAVTFTVSLIVAGMWSPSTSLPLALCDVALLVAAVACWRPAAILVELTYFWGLAGTLQAVVTPDLSSGFPHLVFFEYVVGHLGIVLAAVFLVVGRGFRPRPRAVPRVFLITISYTAFVGCIDGVTDANYMFLRSPPGEWTLLKVLGPWPWYIVSAAGVALALLVLLDLPFWRGRRPEAAQTQPPTTMRRAA